MSSRSLTVALLGNVDPDVFWSTENEYLDAYRRAGHTVCPFLEQAPSDWDALIEVIEGGQHFDFIHWTRTKSFADAAGKKRQLRLIVAAKDRGIPLIGVHLDRWWGLRRQSQVFEDLYFTGVDVLFTADGGHQEQWETAGVNHRWLLPAISERWLGLGEPKPEYECDVVFVGGWDNYGHREWKHRAELIYNLSTWYGDRFLALPRRGQPRIVGRDLNDVYASAKIVVGDSCLVPKVDGSPMTHYCSDRIPETLGRGGLLIHPVVGGISDDGGAFAGARGLRTWRLGAWKALRQLIDSGLTMPSQYAESQRQSNVDYITEHHTYTHRVNEIVAVLEAEGLL